MNTERLRGLFARVAEGTLQVEAAVEEAHKEAHKEVAGLSVPAGVDDLGFARVDAHRAARCGFPEVVFCEGKSPHQVVAIARSLFERCGRVLATRADESVRAALASAFEAEPVEENATARAVLVGSPMARRVAGTVLVISAGTGDIPVAEEAAFTARALGSPVETLYDVGVAGIHRLFGSWETIRRASVLVVIAGMEGALASVVGGLVSRPVVAVPTSVGYGASFGGLAALLAMLNSCAAGVTVVNIDNGFGAGYAAALMNEVAAGPADGERAGKGAPPERSQTNEHSEQDEPRGPEDP